MIDGGSDEDEAKSEMDDELGTMNLDDIQLLDEPKPAAGPRMADLGGFKGGSFRQPKLKGLV